MSTLTVQIPDLLLQQLTELAAKENVGVDQVVASALAAQVSDAPMRASLAARAGRVNWGKVDEILARVPDVSPAPGDELP